jgi:DNA-binding NtrC family response regulator
MQLTSQKVTILCVDDSSDILTLCKLILEANGFDVITASNGRVALVRLKENAIDAAVIDNAMPGMSGVRLAQEIKGTHKDVPVLMFSGSLPSPDALSSVDGFLNKNEGPAAFSRCSA